MVKTPGEQKRLIETLRITEAAFEATTAAAYPGVTERELKRIFDTVIVAAGARPAFALIRFGRGMALGQVEPGDTKLERGDYIWYDIGCTYRGYRSDIGRIVSYGEPSKRLRDLYQASIAGQDCAFEMMTPGTEARAVFNAAVERVREAGIPQYERHHVGHGIGVEFYDAPVLSPGVETRSRKEWSSRSRPLTTNSASEERSSRTPYHPIGRCRDSHTHRPRVARRRHVSSRASSANDTAAVKTTRRRSSTIRPAPALL